VLPEASTRRRPGAACRRRQTVWRGCRWVARPHRDPTRQVERMQLPLLSLGNVRRKPARPRFVVSVHGGLWHFAHSISCQWGSTCSANQAPRPRSQTSRSTQRRGRRRRRHLLAAEEACRHGPFGRQRADTVGDIFLLRSGWERSTRKRSGTLISTTTKPATPTLPTTILQIELPKKVNCAPRLPAPVPIHAEGHGGLTAVACLTAPTRVLMEV